MELGRLVATSKHGLLWLALGALGCSASPPAPPTGASTSVTVAEAPVPAPTATEAAVSPKPPAPSAAPSASASVVASSAPAVATEVPHVRVENIGMHIGGGPNDAPTKQPIKDSVSPHFDDLKRCYGRATEQVKGDFGVDLLIDKDGGKPLKVSHVKTTLKGDDYRACMLSVFEGIEFLKPKGGKTTVSYSVRFSP